MIRAENTLRDAGLHAAAIAKWENEGGALGRAGGELHGALLRTDEMYLRTDEMYRHGSSVR